MAKQLNSHAVPWEPKVPQPQLQPAPVSAAITYLYPTNYFGSQYCYYYFREEEYFSYYDYYSLDNTTTPSAAVQPCEGQYGVVFSAGERKVVETYGRIDGGPTKSGQSVRRLVPPRLRSRFVERRVRRIRFQWKPKTSNSAGGGSGGDSGAASSGGSCVVGLASPPISDDDDLFGGCKTSVMIKNIPNQFRRNMLIEFLDKLSEKNQLEYDFLYLPMDFVRKNSLGYAFVNFTSARAATRIREVLEGYKWGCIQTELGSVLSNKICEVTYARIQGKEALVRNFEKSTFCCSNYEWLPVIFTPPRNGLGTTTSEQITIGKWRAPS